ncbi:lipopolysaccharide export system permease protein [Tenacibaculum adriaticum]|uniref:Lipopolysaccharide export system permease protein n=1 Tax=Tenacibaculum adriaticum TaxID=413713 RepID=A0A5S5DPL0_9FLAO|nr:LptF/LptG family permease [Tenacibaculum adriaticum]TYP96772.1 lipopolysaccharide export system permease protein [Tenacibaculum adriaticum]
MFITTILTTFVLVKTLDKYILKSFLVPFLATFFIILFVLVMQTLWLAFDDFAGKGISLIFILKFLWYTTLLVAPQALPIGILLSSIMTLGSLSENYEFAAAKSAGISLQRMVRPLVFFAIFMSAVNFMFLNYVYPYAILKQINLKMNIKKKQPALALVPGSFNTEIPNYQIKFDEKYGEEDNLLKNVLIYDLSAKRGNNKIISAKKGELVSEEGSRYMTLILKNGHFFEHHEKNNSSYKQRQKMPASYADFDEYTINIDISSFAKDDLDDLNYTRNFNMLSLKQLKDTLPTIKLNYDEYVKARAKNLFLNVNAKDLYKYPDSLINSKLSLNLLDNFDLNQKRNIVNTAISKVDRTLNNIKSNKDSFKHKRKVLNLYDIEFYNRVAFSLSCLLLFFIGAPLGSIIRKGGMGLPMILAISIYVLYFFTNTFGRNLAEESSVTALLGSWMAIILMLPLALILTTRATKDKGLFDINGFFKKLIDKFKNLLPKKEKTT